MLTHLRCTRLLQDCTLQAEEIQYNSGIICHVLFCFMHKGVTAPREEWRAGAECGSGLGLENWAGMKAKGKRH